MNSILNDLEREVQEIANQYSSIDLLIRLVDKESNSLKKVLDQQLYNYLILKARYQRVIRDNYNIELENCPNFLYLEYDKYYDRLNLSSYITNLKQQVKIARKNYYVAKHRYEGIEHSEQCSCRGCKCIASVST